MEKIKHYAIYDILSKEEILSLLELPYFEWVSADWEARKGNIRMFNTTCIELPSSTLGGLVFPKKHLICGRVMFWAENGAIMVPGRYRDMVHTVPGLVGISFWWQRHFAGAVDMTVFIEEYDGKYRLVNKDLKGIGIDVRLFVEDGNVYAYDRQMLRIFRVESDYSITTVYEINSYHTKRASPHGEQRNITGPNRSVVKFNLHEEVLTFIDGFYRSGVLLVDMYGKNRTVDIIRQEIAHGRRQIETIETERAVYIAQKDVVAARIKAGGPQATPEERSIMAKILAMTKSINEINDRMIDNEKLINLNIDKTGMFVAALSLFDYRYIPYDPDFPISMSGSNLTGKQEDIERYRSNYGVLPLFSLSSPLIEITHPRFGKCYLGLGHTKILSVPTDLYIAGSAISQFRDNLYADYEKLYPGRYAIHGKNYRSLLTGQSVDEGYIYMMYFYVLTMDGKMYITDSYIPFDAMARQEYVFALTFPMSVYEKGDYLITSGGEGDYYSYMAKFKKSSVMDMRWHDISHCDMREYGYYFYLFLENGEHRIVSRLAA